MGAFGKGQAGFVAPLCANRGDVIVVRGPGCDFKEDLFCGVCIFCFFGHDIREGEVP